MFTKYVVVETWQRALQRLDGERTVELGPGRHRVARAGGRVATYEFVDMRERMDTTGVQEVLTADGVTIRATAVIRWAVASATAFSEIAVSPLSEVYVAVQVALREQLAALTADEVVRTGRSVVADAVTAAAIAAGRPVGIAVREVVLRDVLLPAELRAAYSDVVAGRQRAIVQLEAARAETAALRSLANGAKLLQDNPELARLRVVQALPMGSTVKLS